MRLTHLALVLAAVALLLPAAEAPAKARWPERVVRKRLKSEFPAALRVSCRAHRARRYYSCRWRGRRRVSWIRTRRCTGRYTVRRRHGRTRLRRSGRRRCRTLWQPEKRLVGFSDGAALNQPDLEGDLAARAGATVHLVTFDWRWVEARRGRPDFARYDRLYRALRARGIRPLWALAFAPSWAIDGKCNQYIRDCLYPPDPAYLPEWRRIAAEVARRYPESAGIQVWNEPNLALFWQPRPDPARYTELLRNAYSAVKAVRPSMPVVGGAMNDLEFGRDNDIGLSDFARALYANGARGSMDGLAIHDYPESLNVGAGSHFERTLRTARAVRDAAGDGGTPLWITETGLSTTDRRFGFNETDQADGLVRVLEAVKPMRDVEVLAYYRLLEDRTDYLPLVGYGIVRPDGSPKPAYCALAAAIGAVRPCS